MEFLPEEYLKQLDEDEAEKKKRVEESLKHIKLSNRGFSFVPQFVMQVEGIRSRSLLRSNHGLRFVFVFPLFCHADTICEDDMWHLQTRFPARSVSPRCRSIDLGYNKLTVIPSDLTLHCEGTIQSLVLWNNYLVSLPPEIARCTKLTDLKLGNNHLPNLPEHIGRLTALNKLDVSGNRIASVPSSLSHLVDLKLLNFSRNSLQVRPALRRPRICLPNLAEPSTLQAAQTRIPASQRQSQLTARGVFCRATRTTSSGPSPTSLSSTWARISSRSSPWRRPASTTSAYSAPA